ncbi:MAG: ribosome-associated translation inhibitor RaiA [Verrucomicrobia bacterium]|nr:ribosome-associated translation inhibitor RaiA [Verrucomicrobiota bacterium]
MKLILSTHNVTAAEAIENHIRSRLEKLDHMASRAVEARVYLEHDNAKVADKRFKCGIRLAVPGPDLFAEEWGPELRSTVDLVCKKLQEQIRRRHEKLTRERQNEAARRKREEQDREIS